MTDPRTVRLVAALIGLTALAAVIGTVVLLAQDKPADAALAGLAGTALGYLAGVLTPSAPSGPQAVTVQQPAGQPVPVADASDGSTRLLDDGAVDMNLVVSIILGIVLAVGVLYVLRLAF